MGLSLLVAGFTIASADEAVVQAGDRCLRLRETPSLTAPILGCLLSGSSVETLDGNVEADGYAWREVESLGRHGWVAASYLQRTAPPASSPRAFVTPPPGGVTVGIAGTTSISEIIEAQRFEVASLTVLDISSQRFLLYVPGAPADENTLRDGRFAPTDIVLVGRAGTYEPPDETSIRAVSSARGIALALPVPPLGGLTVGLAGTNDIDDIITAQPFVVASLSTWDVQTQQWLTHIVGAPSGVNTLTEESLSASTPIFIRRSTTADTPVPTVASSEAPPETIELITYYYCEKGSLPASWGDGGGFCGHMRNGEVVHPGAAACAPEYFGSRFRIEGDPTERIYTCTDTGGAVGSGHRDIWFNNSDQGFRWRNQVGRFATVIPVP